MKSGGIRNCSLRMRIPAYGDMCAKLGGSYEPQRHQDAEDKGDKGAAPKVPKGLPLRPLPPCSPCPLHLGVFVSLWFMAVRFSKTATESAPRHRHSSDPVSRRPRPVLRGLS